jgi:hypothetical protein
MGDCSATGKKFTGIAFGIQINKAVPASSLAIGATNGATGTSLVTAAIPALTAVDTWYEFCLPLDFSTLNSVDSIALSVATELAAGLGDVTVYLDYIRFVRLETEGDGTIAFSAAGSTVGYYLELPFACRKATVFELPVGLNVQWYRLDEGETSMTAKSVSRLKSGQTMLDAARPCHAVALTLATALATPTGAMTDDAIELEFTE